MKSRFPKPHYPGIEAERYKQVLAQVDLADEVGFDYFWTVEHHFLREFSHCSAPEVLYGAISQRTKRIRIGHAVALLPGSVQSPGEGGGAGRGAGHSQRRSHGPGHRAVHYADRDGRVRSGPGRDPCPVAGSHRHYPQDVDRGPILPSRRVLQYPGAVG